MKKYQIFLSENFPCLVVKNSRYLNRRIFIMLELILVLVCHVLIPECRDEDCTQKLSTLGKIFSR